MLKKKKKIGRVSKIDPEFTSLGAESLSSKTTTLLSFKYNKPERIIPLISEAAELF